MEVSIYRASGNSYRVVQENLNVSPENPPLFEDDDIPSIDLSDE